MGKKSQPDVEPRPPIAFHHGSNGEYAPKPPTEFARRASALYREVVDDRSRRLGVSRRDFVQTWAGAAATLYVANHLGGCGGSSGENGDAGFVVDADSTLDDAKACEELSGDEFIFDVQTHHVNPDGDWRDAGTLWPLILDSFPQANCGEADSMACYDSEHYIRELFVNSDTSIAVLSAVPAVEDENPLVVAEQRQTRELVEMLSGSPRLVIHGLVIPNLGPSQLDGMEQLLSDYQISAWKVYTQFGGWWLDDGQIGIPFIEKARSLGVNIICAHKGLTLPGFDGQFASPQDIGKVASMYPDMNFVAYHSGYETTITEGPYDAGNAQGVDTLVEAVLTNEIEPNTNVYAELGSTWRNVMMTGDDQAAHVIGKLLKYVGEDNVLWGTDSIWYGTPQDQIMAFRAFQIPPALQDQHDYPELTPVRKAKILGLNAAALYGVDPEATLCEIREDDLAMRKIEREVQIARSFRGYGPQTRREFFRFLRARDGQPG